jgi:hypothetical protein
LWNCVQLNCCSAQRTKRHSQIWMNSVTRTPSFILEKNAPDQCSHQEDKGKCLEKIKWQGSSGALCSKHKTKSRENERKGLITVAAKLRCHDHKYWKKYLHDDYLSTFHWKYCLWDMSSKTDDIAYIQAALTNQRDSINKWR